MPQAPSAKPASATVADPNCFRRFLSIPASIACTSSALSERALSFFPRATSSHSKTQRFPDPYHADPSRDAPTPSLPGSTMTGA